MNPTGWIEQADLATGGDLEGLKKITGLAQGRSPGGVI
jgi:hypothetical protein